MGVGFRVFEKIERVPEDAVVRLGRHSVPNLSDALRGLYVVDTGIRPLHDKWQPFVGTAVTVDVTPGDGLLVRKAVELLQAGDVLVINAHGCVERAVLGGNVAIDLVNRGVAGIVVDGAVRDAEEMAALGLPVFGRGVTPRSGTTAAGWGEVNGPVACGGVVVFPGDVVVCDWDGIAVIPAADVEQVLDRVDRIEGLKGRPEDITTRAAEAKSAPIHGLQLTEEQMAKRGCRVVSGSYRRGG